MKGRDQKDVKVSIIRKYADAHQHSLVHSMCYYMDTNSVYLVLRMPIFEMESLRVRPFGISLNYRRILLKMIKIVLMQLLDTPHVKTVTKGAILVSHSLFSVLRGEVMLPIACFLVIRAWHEVLKPKRSSCKNMGPALWTFSH